MSNCTGCGACNSACPKGAISLKRNDNGFLYPLIDKNKCVECGICKKVCHINNDVELNKVQSKSLFRNSDFAVRRKSSSGGTFAPISEIAIKDGGYVFGAEFSDDLTVRHNCYNEIDKAIKFSTSKYVQSDLGDSYSQVEEKLKSGEKVVFSGTPCQVAGLNSYLKYKKCPIDNLLTVDFICHGVGSPRFWDDCLSYYTKKFGHKIISANFRGKPRPGKLQNLELGFDNGKKYYAPSANMEIFFFHFLKNYILRESCFSCKYSKTDRVADLTLGDCFKVNEKLSYLNDGFGLSQIMINTEKGRKFIESIREYGELVEVNTDDYMQPNLRKPTAMPGGYKSFWTEYCGYGFQNALKVSGYFSIKNRIKHTLLKIAYYLKVDSYIKKLAKKLKH